MKPLHTGHAEIDQQHDILENMVGDLSCFCPKADRESTCACGNCNTLQVKQCAQTLVSIISNVTAYHIGHSTYEERMMDLLPSTPRCQAHIRAHKAAHDGMLKQLKKFTIESIGEHPDKVVTRMRTLLTDWLNDHVSSFDTHLVGLSAKSHVKVNFDTELVEMLDLHVFPNRPTIAKLSSSEVLSLNRKRLEVRGRFETLSPSQRSVFWLVVGGKTNPIIAQELGVSVNTVKTHRAAVFQKMDVRSVLELVKMADVLR